MLDHQGLMMSLTTYSLTITAVRVSVLLLYRRLFDTELYRKFLVAAGLASLAWLIAEVLTNIFSCWPISAAFDARLLHTDQCINFQAFYWGISATNMVLDIAVLCLPMHVIWKLQLPTKQKALLAIIFLMGGLLVLIPSCKTLLTGLAPALPASCAYGRSAY